MNFVGIGVSYIMEGEQAIITQVFKDAPADKAGVQAGDIMAKVDGKSLSGYTTEQIKELVIGEEGTALVLTVIREGKEVDLTVIRGEIDTTVYGYTLDDVAILKIYSFGDNSYHECIKYLDTFTEHKKLIIDLRDDGGGYQSAVEEIAGLFLPKGTIMMRQVYLDGDESEFKTSSNITYSFDKIVILTNENTASAAEVLTIALKEQLDNVIQVGTTTYGKGVVQSTFYLNDGSAFKVTSSKWLSPNGVSIDHEGIVPDYEVLLDDALLTTYEDFEEGQSFKIDAVSKNVEAAQKSLKYLGYEVDRIDGYFSSKTSDALKQYQSDRGLNSTGELDANTFKVLRGSVIRAFYFEVAKDSQLSKALELLNG